MDNKIKNSIWPIIRELERIYDSLKQSIMMRICSENIGLIGRFFK